MPSRAALELVPADAALRRAAVTPDIRRAEGVGTTEIINVRDDRGGMMFSMVGDVSEIYDPRIQLAIEQLYYAWLLTRADRRPAGRAG